MLLVLAWVGQNVYDRTNDNLIQIKCVIIAKEGDTGKLITLKSVPKGPVGAVKACCAYYFYETC